MDELKKRFKITTGGRLKKHLGIDYEWIKDDEGMTSIVATMEKRVKDIIKSYEDVTGLRKWIVCAYLERFCRRTKEKS